MQSANHTADTIDEADGKILPGLFLVSDYYQ